MSATVATSGCTTAVFGELVANVNEYFDRDEGRVARYLAGEHLDERDLAVRRWGMTDDAVFPPTFKRMFKARDVLFHSRNPEKVVQPTFDGVTGEKLFVLRAKDPSTLLQTLVPYLLLTEHFADYVRRTRSGSVNKFLNWTPLAQYEFVLPPLEEQRRIAEVLEAAQGHVDTFAALEAASDTLRVSALDSILVGHSEQSDRRIEEARLPEHWSLTSVSEIAIAPVTSGVTPRNCSKDADPSCSFIKVGDLTFDGRLDYGHDGAKINRAAFEDTSRLHVQPGDVLTNIVGPPLGKVSVVPEEVSTALINQAIVRFRMPDAQMQIWLTAFLMSSWAKLWLLARSTKTSGQRNINATTCAALPVPIPPSADLRALVRELERVQQAHSNVRQRHQDARRLLTQLLPGALGA